VLTPQDLAALLSPAALPFLEEMAQKAQMLTAQYFGKVIQMYTPLYIADHCLNACAYCGYNTEHSFSRTILSLKQVSDEGAYLAGIGFRHLLVLTGDEPHISPVGYIAESVKVLKAFVSSVSTEVYALTQDEYAELVAAGCDGVTMYQETYDTAVYDRVHLSGPKRDYQFRLDAPERAALAGMRQINVGALLGLAQWRRDAMLGILHCSYLMRTVPGIEAGIGVPRMRPHEGSFKDVVPVSDTDLVQYILAARLYNPRAGITVSTRESAELRDRLLLLGVTRMSASSSTAVGGHTNGNAQGEQFAISDTRTIAQMTAMLASRGYDPVTHDWMAI
jgi:2-iminoacetate synthase